MTFTKIKIKIFFFLNFNKKILTAYLFVETRNKYFFIEQKFYIKLLTGFLYTLKKLFYIETNCYNAPNKIYTYLAIYLFFFINYLKKRTMVKKDLRSVGNYEP